MNDLERPWGVGPAGVVIGDHALITAVESYDERLVLHFRSRIASLAEPYPINGFNWTVTDDLGTGYIWLGGGGGGGHNEDWIFTTLCWTPGPPSEATRLTLQIPGLEDSPDLTLSVSLPR